MAVTFGTVQLVPALSAQPASGGAAPAPSASVSPPDARDLGPVLHHLHGRAARVRAH